jgi:hypothetical protein
MDKWLRQAAEVAFVDKEKQWAAEARAGRAYFAAGRYHLDKLADKFKLVGGLGTTSLAAVNVGAVTRGAINAIFPAITPMEQIARNFEAQAKSRKEEEERRLAWLKRPQTNAALERGTLGAYQAGRDRRTERILLDQLKAQKDSAESLKQIEARLFPEEAFAI